MNTRCKQNGDPESKDQVYIYLKQSRLEFVNSIFVGSFYIYKRILEKPSSDNAALLTLIGQIAGIMLAVVLFFFALDLMSNSFQHLSKDTVRSMLQGASNPFIGLFVGLLITALIQSSSTSTTIIVTAVASGNINFTDAVPMIMGANIGTTITSTIVALGFIGKREEFRRALSAGVVHDLFNILVVIILFPLELKYQFLSSISNYLSSMILPAGASAGGEELHIVLISIAPLTSLFTSFSHNSFINLVISFILLFGSIKMLSKIISGLIMGNSTKRLKNYIFNNATKSFFWGTLVTAGVQSSSITTSVVVPFVATKRISLERITPFIIGANIGTTITAFIAVFFKSYEVINIALTHLIFNVVGVLIFLPFPLLRKIPVVMAEKFASVAAKYRFLVIIYIMFVFFIIPFFLIFFTQNF